jgi:TRAP-type C4-dicarboxylate transport system substrate-binding protein
MVLITMSILLACATPTTVLITEPAPAPEPPATEVITLNYSTHIPPVSDLTKIMEQWAQKIAESTSGRVEINIYAGGVLVPQSDMVAGVKGGITDIGELSPMLFLEEYPLTSIFSLPFLYVGTTVTSHKVWMEVENKIPAVRAEFDDFKIVADYTAVTQQLHTAKKQIRVPGDLKGVKLIASGTIAEVMYTMGASAIFVALPDWYKSLERSLVEGIWMPPDAIYEMKAYKLLPYHTIFPSGVTMTAARIIMNLDRWNKLPPDIKKVFEDLKPWLFETRCQIADEAANRAVTAMEEEGGHTFITLTPDEEKVWKEVARQVHNEYLDKLESKGIPAKKVYEEIQRLAEQYRK